MGDLIAISFEYERAPVLWGGAVTAAGGTVSLLVVQQPLLLLAVGVLGGIAAGLRSGFYSQTTTNGVAGVALGVVLLLPILLGARLLHAIVGPGSYFGVGDLVFLSHAGWFLLVILWGPLMLIGGFVAAGVVGVVRPGPKRQASRFGE